MLSYVSAFSVASLILRRPHASAQPPLFFKELDYGLLKCRLVRRGVMVAFTFGAACGWDCFEKPGDLLVGGICLPIQNQDRYVDSLESFGGPARRDHTANHGRQNFWVSSSGSSRYEARRGEVSSNNFPLLQDSCPLLRPHPSKEVKVFIQRLPT